MDRLPPLRLLATFEAVARLGSMRAAAAWLNVTQAAVTQTLKALEDHVGASLLDRTTRPARLTDAGQMLAQATCEGLGLIATVIDDIRAVGKADARQLTVGCTLGMATYWLMPRLPEFYALHPDFPVNVQAPPTDLPTLSSGIDLALRYGTGKWNDGRTVRLFDERIGPVGHPALVGRLLAAGTPLERAPLIHVRSTHNPHWASWEDYLGHRGLTGAAGGGQTFDNYVHAVQSALDGRGLVLGWRSITGDLVAQGALVPWPDAVIDLDTAYFVTLSPRALSKPAAVAFLDWLLEQARKG